MLSQMLVSIRIPSLSELGDISNSEPTSKWTPLHMPGTHARTDGGQNAQQQHRGLGGRATTTPFKGSPAHGHDRLGYLK